MSEPLKKVHPGDKLRIAASTFNTFIDVANDWKARRFTGGRGSGTTDTGQQFILVQNTTEADLDRFSVLGIDAPIILPSNNLDGFKNRVVLKGCSPAAGDVGRFAILLEPLAKGAIGRACIAGVCPVIVNMSDERHGFAEVQAGETGSLASAANGSAVILWKESGTGEKWALVRLGSGGGGGLSESTTSIWYFYNYQGVAPDEWYEMTLQAGIGENPHLPLCTLAGTLNRVSLRWSPYWIHSAGVPKFRLRNVTQNTYSPDLDIKEGDGAYFAYATTAGLVIAVGDLLVVEVCFPHAGEGHNYAGGDIMTTWTIETAALPETLTLDEGEDEEQ